MARVSRTCEIAAVLPYNEETVLTAAELAEQLGLEWNRLEVMRRFRDKFALKEHLRRQRPDLRLNASRRVSGVDDVFAHPLPARFVLKPNAGFGNRGVGFYTAAVTRRELEAFFARHPGGSWVLEELVGGTEYFVNGQVDAAGRVHVLAAFEYVRLPANGRENIDFETRQVHQDTELFRTLERYAVAVMEATGLVRSPFHLEVKVDALGPCLIEVGARLVGNGNAFVCSDLHGGRVDLLALAVDGYVSPDAPGPPPVDWEHYNARTALYVNGVARHAGVVCELAGVRQVEAMPWFHCWAKRPRFGERVSVTVDSLSMPWSVVLEARRGEDLRTTTERIRELMEGCTAGPPARRVAAGSVELGRRGTRKLAWVMTRARGGGAAMDDSLWRRKARALARRLQEAGVGRRYTGTLEVLTPRRLAQANEMLRWLEGYIAQPHPELGRKGAICPFVAHALKVDRLYFTFHDEVDGSSPAQLRDVLLSHSQTFQERYPPTGPDGSFNSLILLFPNLPGERMGVIDEVHDELKSYLMTRGLMVAQFHERSTKPAIWNPTFHLYKSPYPCFVVRHMDVRDVVFLGHNRFGFEEFYKRFHHAFDEGKVSNDFGYVDLFQQAKARFGYS